MASRTCTAIVDPRNDGECGDPAHLETSRCPQHLPEPEPPKVVRNLSQRGTFDVGVFCTCLQRWHWETLKAPSIAVARDIAPPLATKLYRESADRWERVIKQATRAAVVQRRRSNAKIVFKP